MVRSGVVHSHSNEREYVLQAVKCTTAKGYVNIKPCSLVERAGGEHGCTEEGNLT